MIYLEDFSFDNEKLSDYGCMVVSINTPLQNSVTLGSRLVFDTLKNRASNQSRILSSSYEDVITATFDICKSPYKNDSLEFSDSEISFLMRWLNKKCYEKFKPIYDDENYTDLYFYGTFGEISLININGKIVGMTLTFTSNAPFGYADDKVFQKTITRNDETFTFYDDSDEIGYLYPSLYEIKCSVSGDIKISNTMDTKSTLIRQCTVNETITMDCMNKIIQSSKSHLTLYNDFNYNFPRFVNTFSERKNTFCISIPCELKIKYSPIRKAGIIV